MWRLLLDAYRLCNQKDDDIYKLFEKICLETKFNIMDCNMMFQYFQENLKIQNSQIRYFIRVMKANQLPPDSAIFEKMISCLRNRQMWKDIIDIYNEYSTVTLDGIISVSSESVHAIVESAYNTFQYNIINDLIDFISNSKPWNMNMGIFVMDSSVKIDEHLILYKLKIISLSECEKIYLLAKNYSLKFNTDHYLSIFRKFDKSSSLSEMIIWCNRLLATNNIQITPDLEKQLSLLRSYSSNNDDIVQEILQRK